MNKKANIIFDFNRTVFDPEGQKIIDGVFEMLSTLRPDYNLHLVSYQNINRDSVISDSGIDSYFDSVMIVPEKTQEVFENIIIDKEIPTYVIGDTLVSEIRIGKDLGYKTIWIQLHEDTPELYIQKEKIRPDITIKNISEVLDIIKNS